MEICYCGHPKKRHAGNYTTGYSSKLPCAHCSCKEYAEKKDFTPIDHSAPGHSCTGQCSKNVDGTVTHVDSLSIADSVLNSGE